MGESEWGVNWAGYLIHGAALRARPDINCALHTHTRAGVAISLLECGVLPVSQHAMSFHNRIGYHDYEGFADGMEECDRLAANLGEHNALVLRNHGLLTVGETVADAFLTNFNLEIACKTQLDAMASGSALIRPADEICEHVARMYWDESSAERPGKQLAWEALIRELDRDDPSFRD